MEDAGNGGQKVEFGEALHDASARPEGVEADDVAPEIEGPEFAVRNAVTNALNAIAPELGFEATPRPSTGLPVGVTFSGTNAVRQTAPEELEKLKGH